MMVVAVITILAVYISGIFLALYLVGRFDISPDDQPVFVGAWFIAIPIACICILGKRFYERGVARRKISKGLRGE